MSEISLRMAPASEAAAATLKEQGFRVATKPLVQKIPSLPRDITSVTDEALMDLFVNVTSWVDYLSVQVACAQVDERSAQKALDLAEANAMASGWTGGRDARVALAKAKLATDPNVVALSEDLDDKHAYRKLIETLANNLERDAALVSRELTRRVSGPSASLRAGRSIPSARH
jgi:hypothetical protein